jgi:hypothetical protein
MINVCPSFENYNFATFPQPTGKSKVSCLISFQSWRLIIFILFYPAKASL